MVADLLKIVQMAKILGSLGDGMEVGIFTMTLNFSTKILGMKVSYFGMCHFKIQIFHFRSKATCKPISNVYNDKRGEKRSLPGGWLL